MRRSCAATLASVAAACLAAVPVDAWRSRRGGVGLVGAASLMRGVSARLDSPDADTRRHGRKVASALALALDPARPLTFDDDEDFGAGEFRDPEGVSGDVSEDEAEWERGDAVFELRDDAEASEEKNREEQSEDAFVASLVGDEAEGNPRGGDGDGRASNPELSHSEGDDERTDDDDPDAAFALGGGGAEASASSEDSDSDDSDASSAYEPYDMDSDEDDDEDEDEQRKTKNEGHSGGDAFGKTGTPPDASRRRARAAKAAARRVASLPKPDGLFRCVEALRRKRGGEESASSRSAVDLADAAEGAVYAVEGLIRAVPEELVSAAAPLVSALVHAHPPTPDAAGLERARRKALVALAATAPGIAGPALCAEAFATGRCDAGQQLEVLDVVADAARELAALAPVRRAALRDADDEDDEGDGTATTRETKTRAALRGRVGVERRPRRGASRVSGAPRGPGDPGRRNARVHILWWMRSRGRSWRVSVRSCAPPTRTPVGARAEPRGGGGPRQRARSRRRHRRAGAGSRAGRAGGVLRLRRERRERRAACRRRARAHLEPLRARAPAPARPARGAVRGVRRGDVDAAGGGVARARRRRTRGRGVDVPAREAPVLGGGVVGEDARLRRGRDHQATRASVRVVLRGPAPKSFFAKRGEAGPGRPSVRAQEPHRARGGLVS